MILPDRYFYDQQKKKKEFHSRKVNKTRLAIIRDEYIEAVKNWKNPAATKEIEKVLGFANYHRIFIYTP